MTPEELRQIREEIRRDMTEENSGSFMQSLKSSQPRLNGKAMVMILGMIVTVSGLSTGGTFLYLGALSDGIKANTEAIRGNNYALREVLLNKADKEQAADRWTSWQQAEYMKRIDAIFSALEKRLDRIEARAKDNGR